MSRRKVASGNAEPVRAALLAWYDQHRRDLPWRRTRDPYAIWVSEIMLQQTRVAAVIERYNAFLQRFPTVNLLAAAKEPEVLALWSGLGYYRRARMLHRAARFVVEHCGGKLPETAEGLRELPGIGPYTAAAIASIAYGEPVAVVDGNVERVVCRLAGWEFADGNGGALRKKIAEFAGSIVDPARPGDFNQAMMELGATVCTPRSPQCLSCPLVDACATRGEHKTEPRAKMVSREVGCALAVREAARGRREVLLEQRPATHTVMPGMWELPSLADSDVPEADLRMTVRHAIMQVNYVVRIRALAEGDIAALTQRNGKRRWVAVAALGELPLTGLARKVLTRAHLLDAKPAGRLAKVL